jgi:hypothetical protein
MSGVIPYLPTAIDLLVGLVALSMASRLFSRRFVPFHEQAAGTTLDRLDGRLQSVVVALMRVSAAGFLVVGLATTVLPVLVLLGADPALRPVAGGLALVFCALLAWANWRLARETGARTPWIASGLAAGALALGLLAEALGP